MKNIKNQLLFWTKCSSIYSTFKIFFWPIRKYNSVSAVALSGFTFLYLHTLSATVINSCFGDDKTTSKRYVKSGWEVAKFYFANIISQRNIFNNIKIFKSTRLLCVPLHRAAFYYKLYHIFWPRLYWKMHLRNYQLFPSIFIVCEKLFSSTKTCHRLLV